MGKMVENCKKKQEVAGNGGILWEDMKNGGKLWELAGSYGNWEEVGGNGEKLLEMAASILGRPLHEWLTRFQNEIQ